jgi:hypothetical protein
MCFDEANGKVLLFGGVRPSGAQLHDTWYWDGSDWIEQSPAHHPISGTEVVSNRITYDENIGKVLYQQGDSSGGFKETWAWDGTDWTQLSPAHQPERPVGMVFDPTRGETVLIGSTNTWVYKFVPA